MPNGALSSLAGNIDPHPRLAVADLILVQRCVKKTIEQLLTELNPARKNPSSTEAARSFSSLLIVRAPYRLSFSVIKYVRPAPEGLYAL